MQRPSRDTGVSYIAASRFPPFLFIQKVKGMDSILYSAISISIVARMIFMYLLYKNRSTNTYSLIFCILNIGSSGLWIYYSIEQDDTRLLIRSTSECTLLAISAAYIIRNKYFTRSTTSTVLPQ